MIWFLFFLCVSGWLLARLHCVNECEDCPYRKDFPGGIDCEAKAHDPPVIAALKPPGNVGVDTGAGTDTRAGLNKNC